MNVYLQDIEKGDLALLHTNIRSLPRNYNDFTNYLQSINITFDIIGLSETWLSDETADVAYLGSDYSHVKCYRNNRRGGGVSLFIHKDMKYRSIPDVCQCKENIESVFIELLHNNFEDRKPVIIGVVYRPPNTDIAVFLEHMNSLLTHDCLRSKRCYIMGDFNINLLNCSTHAATSDFVDNMFSFSYVPLINRPTRISATSATLIDNIFSNNVNVNFSKCGILRTDLSDHLPIFHITRCKKHTLTRSVITKPVINDATLNNMLNELHSKNWDMILHNKNVNQGFTDFIKVVEESYNNNIPQRPFVLKHKGKPWLTKGLLCSIKRKNKLYAIYLRCKTTASHDFYRRYKNKLSHLLKMSERKYYKEKLENNKANLTNTWKILKNIINKNRSYQCQQEFKLNNDVIDDPKQIADEFNKYFVKVGTTLESQIPRSTKSPLDLMKGNLENSIFVAPTCEEEVSKVVLHLKSVSAGHDNINSHVLKHVLPAIIKPLTQLINLSFQSGEVPNELKIAKVIPLYKAGNEMEFSNYRPVSILPIFSKVFEKIMYFRLEEYLNKNNILSSNQFGFRSGHSTALAVSLFIERIYDALDENEYAIGLFLDLSKAFDTVKHDILISKLSHYGIRGLPLEWIRSYLSNRKQYVFYNGYKSNMCDIECGVPQGSILGPVLFLLYINDLCYQSDVLYNILFADDSNFLVSGKNLKQLVYTMNSELCKLSDWFKCNRLSLNVKKTKFIIFHTKKKMNLDVDSIEIDGVIIERVDSIKFLGVIIDESLKWHKHIQYIKGKITKCIGIFLNVRNKLHSSVLRTLYNTLILPYFSYCIIVWGNTHACYRNIIEILQKKVLRLITFSSRLAHTDPLFKQLRILKFDQLYKYNVNLLMYNYINNRLPSHFNNFFLTNDDVHLYNTRSINDMYLNHRKLDICRMGIKYNAPRIWNYLPANIRHFPSMSGFKRMLKKEFFND